MKKKSDPNDNLNLEFCLGWGKDETGVDYVQEPRQLQIPIVSQEECLRSDERFFRITSNRTFCAGDNSGSSPCTGDSGGGFILKRNGKWTLRGIVSVALLDSQKQSCDMNSYVVFSDVAKFKSWIDTILKK